MKKMMLEDPAKKTNSTAKAKNGTLPLGANLPPKPQQAGFGSNKIVLVLGALLVAGMIFNRRKGISPPARPVPVAPLPVQ